MLSHLKVLCFIVVSVLVCLAQCSIRLYFDIRSVLTVTFSIHIWQKGTKSDQPVPPYEHAIQLANMPSLSKVDEQERKRLRGRTKKDKKRKERINQGLWANEINGSESQDELNGNALRGLG